MHARRSLIVLLVAANLLLLAALVFEIDSTPAAYAQSGARPGDFVCVTAKAAGQSYDVLYVLDVRARKLFSFYPTSAQRNQLAPTAPRDLVKDFRPK